MVEKIWTDEDELEYQMGDMNGVAFIEDPEEKIGCDKPHHLARSIHHQPNHLKHIRSVPIIQIRKSDVKLFRPPEVD